MKKNISLPYKSPAIFLLIALVIFSSCTKNTNVTPAVTKISPDAGAGNDVITLTGSGLQHIQSAVLDNGNVPIALNTNFNTSSAVIFRVPAAANVGDQHIVFTNTSGYQFSVPFTVLAIPTLTSAFPVDWEAGNTVTITGNYLESTSHVSLTGTSDTAMILSASATQLVLKMPASLAATTKLTITNNAGSSTTSFSLINMDQQLKFYTEDYGPAMQDWSWSTSARSTDFAVSGVSSLKEKFGAGGGQGLSFHWDNTITTANYQYLSFYVKGGSADNVIKVSPDAIVSGTGSSSPDIPVPSGVWTYVTVSMALFSGVTCQRFNFQITGPTTDQTLYFDNVILVKQ
ncbi:MAG: IPT/TIG domain-containing protein [Chitinophaga rupis]